MINLEVTTNKRDSLITINKIERNAVIEVNSKPIQVIITKEQSVSGRPGKDGKDAVSIPGKDGQDGSDGLSAYEIAVKNGFVGTEVEWLDSLKASSGATSSIISPTASTAISAFRAIYVNNNSASYCALDSFNPVTGISITGASIGQQVSVQLSGTIESPGLGLTPGATYFLGANGIITSTIPTQYRYQVLGTAISGSKFLIEIEQPIYLE